MSIVHCPAWPPRIVLDEPIGRALERELRRVHATRPFVVASRSLAQAGLAAELGPNVVGLACGVPQHAPQATIVEIAARARACAADAVISVGGGSVVDAAKLVHLMLAQDISDLAGLQAWRLAKPAGPARTIPHICAPTTLSGAEFTWFAGARNPQSGLKDGFAARWLIPSVILLDPDLARRTPIRLWLSTGVRAIDHAVEALFAKDLNPLAQTLCLEGLRRIIRALERAAAEPQDVAARRESQTAAWFCAAGLMSGLPMGASHALGHVLGALFDIPHGITSCVTLPAVMAFNGAAAPDRLALCAEALGPDPATTLRRWIAAQGLPTGLDEIGVGPDRREAVIAAACSEAWLSTNPRPISGPQDIAAILDLAR